MTMDEQVMISDAIKTLMRRPYHPFPPGLRVHKLEGVTGVKIRKDDKPPPVWEMHASGDLLITFQYGTNEVVFLDCGDHDHILH
jgi:mRNA-degrading endonuclease YafQ of YafQ-DinJ toxin-antitoxin module